MREYYDDVGTMHNIPLLFYIFSRSSFVLYFILYFFVFYTFRRMVKELCVSVCVSEYADAPICSYIGWLAVWQKVYYYMITMSLVTFLMASILTERV